jgi:tRNA(Arg) A34 adenosine deaminase TadA
VPIVGAPRHQLHNPLLRLGIGGGLNFEHVHQHQSATSIVSRAVLMTRASLAYSADFMAGCTMYASAEPCAMCAGSAYWAGVGRVVYGLSERDLGQLIGPHPENLTMDLPCRIVLGAGQRTVEVAGPLLEDESRAVHEGFWG